MEWVLAHMEDPDFDTPLPAAAAAPAVGLPAAAGSGSGPTSGGADAPDPESVAMLASMTGFSEEQAARALTVRADAVCWHAGIYWGLA